MQTDGRFLISPLPPILLEPLQTAASLRSTDIYSASLLLRTPPPPSRLPPISRLRRCRVGQWRLAGFDDAAVSIALAKIPDGKFSQSGFKAGIISDAAFPVPWFAIPLQAFGRDRGFPLWVGDRCAFQHLRASGVRIGACRTAVRIAAEQVIRRTPITAGVGCLTRKVLASEAKRSR